MRDIYKNKKFIDIEQRYKEIHDLEEKLFAELNKDFPPPEPDLIWCGTLDGSLRLFYVDIGDNSE